MRMIPLRKRCGSVVDYAAVDDADYAVLSRHTWRLSAKGYAYRARKVGGKSIVIFLHSAVMGSTPDASRPLIDHRDRNRLNCRRENLRWSSRYENARNANLRRDNSSGFRGVHKHGPGVWRASIRVNGKARHLGLFDSPQDAAEAYATWAERLHGEFASLGK